MSVSIQGGTARRKRFDLSAARSLAVLSLGLLLIFSQVCLLSSAEKTSHGGSRWSPARKARFYGSAPSHARASNPSSEKTLYEDEQRLVHTGPNPLHN